MATVCFFKTQRIEGIIFSIESFITLGFLVLLQAVLGFDNLFYISLESKRAPQNEQAKVRKLGIGIAVILRIVLLFILTQIIDYFQNPLFGINIGHWVTSEFNLHSIIVLFGGALILYTAVKEIFHMLLIENFHGGKTTTVSANKIILMIVAMNLVFSFDSILSAMALTDNFWIMAIAIVISGILMILLADKVSEFLQKNRIYEVLGLFVLFIVGIMLVSEGGHMAHIHLFGSEITVMSKSTFYFVISILVLTDLVQTKYQKNLLKQKEASL